MGHNLGSIDHTSWVDGQKTHRSREEKNKCMNNNVDRRECAGDQREGREKLCHAGHLLGAGTQLLRRDRECAHRRVVVWHLNGSWN
jgi:hypothetical protein